VSCHGSLLLALRQVWGTFEMAKTLPNFIYILFTLLISDSENEGTKICELFQERTKFRYSELKILNCFIISSRLKTNKWNEYSLLPFQKLPSTFGSIKKCSFIQTISSLVVYLQLQQTFPRKKNLIFRYIFLSKLCSTKVESVKYNREKICKKIARRNFQKKKKSLALVRKFDKKTEVAAIVL
jgi:hypothetical protein